MAVIAARAATTIDGGGMPQFIQQLHEALGREAVDSAALAESMGADLEQVTAIMDSLVEAGVLRSSDAPYPETVVVAALRAGDLVEESVIAERLATDEVGILARRNSPLAGAIAAAAAELNLRLRRVSTIDEAKGCAINVVVGTSHLDPLLLEANESALQTGVPWLPVIPYDGVTAWVGPFARPHESACLRCFVLRRSANFPDDVFRPDLLRLEPQADPPLEFGPSPVHQLQAGVVASFLLEHLGLRDHAPSAVPGGLTSITLDDRGLEVSTRRVYRVPRCPACSPAADTGFPQVWFHGEAAVER